MVRRLVLMLALLAPGAGRAGEAGPTTVKLPGGARARVTDHRLELRRGTEKATLPLPSDVTDIARASGGDPTTLTLERICPPALTMTLTGPEVEARFLLAGAQARLRTGGRAEALATLTRAMSAAPRQVDLRLALARLQLEDKAEAASVETLRAGLERTPLETYWGMLADDKLAALAPKLGLPQQPAGLAGSGEAPLFRGVWSPARKWFAIGVETGSLEVFDLEGRTLFTTELAAAADLDGDGALTGPGRQRMRNRVRLADRLLGAFAFRALDAAGRIEGQNSGDQSLSWLRWKDHKLVASAGGTVIRLRRDGKVIFERKIDTTGTIGLDWGQYLADGPLAVMAWSRRSGNDECPNGSGLAIVKLPGP
jgi:hypothetical protein